MDRPTNVLPTDQPTDQPKDTASYGGALSHLKIGGRGAFRAKNKMSIDRVFMLPRQSIITQSQGKTESIKINNIVNNILIRAKKKKINFLKQCSHCIL